jgi:hypothetical protein
VSQDYVQFDMNWDPVSLTPDLHDNVILEFKKLETLGITSVDVSTLQYLVTSQPETPPFLHNAHFGFNTMAMLTSMTLFMLGLHLCCLIRKYREWGLQEQFIKDGVRATLNTASTHQTFNEDIKEPMYLARQTQDQSFLLWIWLPTCTQGLLLPTDISEEEEAHNTNSAVVKL